MPGDENLPPSGTPWDGSPKKSRPTGHYAKHTRVDVDLKTTISKPYSFRTGKVGLGIAETIALRRANGLGTPHNLALDSSLSCPVFPADETQSAIAKFQTSTVRPDRKRSVLRKPQIPSVNISPLKFPTKTTAAKSTVHKPRNLKTSQISSPIIYEPAVEHRWTDSYMRCPPDSPETCSSLYPSLLSAQQSTPIINQSKGVSEHRMHSSASVVIHPNPDQYESLLNSGPSFQALTRSDSSRPTKFPSFGSVKSRSRGLDKLSRAPSTTSPVISSSGLSTQLIRRKNPPVAFAHTEGRIPTESPLREPKPKPTTLEKTSYSTPPSPICRSLSKKYQRMVPSTMALDALGTQANEYPSLLCSSRSLQDLASESITVQPSASLYDQSTLSPVSFSPQNLPVMPFGSVKPRSNIRASIATSAMNVEPSRTMKSISDVENEGDNSILLNESPPFAVSATACFTTPLSIQEDYARNKHERLLAAILDTVPSSPEASLPSIVVSGEGDLNSTEPSLSLSTDTSTVEHDDIRKFIDTSVPAITITDSIGKVEEGLGLPSSSSSFSVIDLYVGRPEMPCLGPQRFRGNNTTSASDRYLETSRSISKVNALRNSVTFPQVQSNHRLSAVVESASIASALDKRRNSFLSPGMPSSFLSMSAVNEDREEGKQPGLKSLFRRSISKGSLTSNSGQGRPQTVYGSFRKEIDSRRASGWGFFKWMKG